MLARMTRKSIAETLKKDMPYLRHDYGVRKIFLFGSFAKGRPKRSSDIDLMVEFERPIGLKFMDLADHLEKLLGRKVDLLTLEGLKSIRIQEVAKGIERTLVNV